MSEDTITTPSRLDSLKARADKMGIKYHPSIGEDALAKKIEDKMEGTESSDSTNEPAPTTSAGIGKNVESSAALRRRLKKDAEALVRIRVTCMNPLKKEWPGEIFTVSNSIVGTQRKMVPFNVEYHVPKIIYKQMLSRQYQYFYTEKAPNGQKIRKGKLVNEFAIEVLPQLTEKELKELARQQALSRGVEG
ncbi:hypothetical protein [Marinobacterium litorale]|uniref:hypothetical protein n=1 Tax=Marinobacterium litorale TaxID=404770 RepID=UPI00040C82D2|nr:hypothetical protein [Marinobacterium litorale]